MHVHEKVKSCTEYTSAWRADFIHVRFIALTWTIYIAVLYSSPHFISSRAFRRAVIKEKLYCCNPGFQKPHKYKGERNNCYLSSIHISLRRRRNMIPSKNRLRIYADIQVLNPQRRTRIRVVVSDWPLYDAIV